jgi:predicted nucleic acid-binding Zn ribbon protein
VIQSVIMKRSEFQSLGSVIREFLKEEKFDCKIAEIEAVNLWESIIGKQIARATSSIYIKDGTLYIHLKSSIVRNELFMMRNDIMQVINQRIGRRVVKAIILK